MLRVVLRRATASLSGAVFLCTGTVGAARCAWGQKIMTDAIDLPPVHREFMSPSANFVLTISSDDHWATPMARAALNSRRAGVQQIVWRQTLLNIKGPRRAMITDYGAVILIDDWINSPSDHALSVLSAKGKTVATYSLDALIAILNVPRRDVSSHATLGIWLSAEPTVSDDGATVRFRTAGRGLVLRVRDGRITLTK